MSFFNTLGSLLNDVKTVGEEMNELKTDITESLIGESGVIRDIRDQASHISESIQTETTKVVTDLKNTIISEDS